MTNTNFETNVINSFDLAKKDIYALHQHIKVLWQEVEQLKTQKNVTNYTYVASKKGKKAHQANCLFARKINKENKLVFGTKTEALNDGFKLCSCLSY